MSWTSAPKIVDVRTKNRGRPRQKCVSCGPGDEQKLFDPCPSIHKGQECLQEIRTKKIMLILSCSSLSEDPLELEGYGKILNKNSTNV